MSAHFNSDDENEDDDPYYEYNKCHTYTFLEKKLQESFEKFEPVELSTFGLPRVQFEETAINFND